MTRANLKTRHSHTAYITALYRAVANREFEKSEIGPDYLAEWFLPMHVRLLIRYEKMRAKGKAKEKAKTPGVYEYMLARTVIFDYVFINALNESIPQIVLLGAGYDTRAYRFAGLNTSTRIFELDLEATQTRKLKCLKKANIGIPELVTHIPIDFNTESLKDVLERAGYDSDQKTLFLWEGVCMYLEPESVDATLKFISRSSHNQSLIIFDYPITITNENKHKYYGVEALIKALKQNPSKESLNFSIDETEIESFLDRNGLEVVRHFNNKQLAESISSKEQGTPIAQMNGLFRIVIASPKHDQ